MNLAIAAIALIFAAVLGGAGSYKVTTLYWQHRISVEADKANVAINEANRKAEDAAGQYETWKAAQRPKTITIQREVVREVKADTDCSLRAIPDGLRSALVKSSTDSNQPDPSRGVPAASAASPYELGRVGDRLLGHAAGTTRLP